MKLKDLIRSALAEWDKHVDKLNKGYKSEFPKEQFNAYYDDMAGFLAKLMQPMFDEMENAVKDMGLKAEEAASLAEILRKKSKLLKKLTKDVLGLMEETIDKAGVKIPQLTELIQKLGEE